MNNRRPLGKRFGIKSTLKSRLLAALTGVLVGSAVGAVPSPDQVFDRYVAAVHAGDMDTVRSLIAPDVERSDFVGCSPAMDNASCLAHYLDVTVVEPKARLTVVRKVVEGDISKRKLIGYRRIQFSLVDHRECRDGDQIAQLRAPCGRAVQRALSR
jgi:hypothetical protein